MFKSGVGQKSLNPCFLKREHCGAQNDQMLQIKCFVVNFHI